MNVETFCEHFATFTEAPNGAEKLRELVLHLAVQGKLLPHDEKDEPIHEVVRRIDSARHQKSNPVESSGLPRGWMWVRMSQIADHRLGKMLDKAKNKGELFPYLRNTNVQWWRFALDDLKEMRFLEDELKEYEVRVGDLLVCEGGEPGRCAVWSDSTRRLMIQKAIHRIRPLEGIDPYFLAIRLRLDALTGRLDSQFTGATIKHFTGQELARYSFALPPLAEQKRIVAMVDQLLALCDELAARQAARREARESLVGAMLDRLVSARSSVEFPTHVHRLRDNFDRLFDTPTTIPQLRQTILQLAVQGQLVPQDPNDEAVSVLLDSVSKARRKFEEQTSARQRSELVPVEDSEPMFEAPSSWRWIRFGELANIVGGVTLGRKLDGREVASFPYLRVANVQQGRLDLTVIKEVPIPIDELPKYQLRRGDVLLTEGGDWDKLGRSAIWRDEIKTCLHQNHIFRARPFSTGVRSEWITLFTNSPVGRSFFQSASKQTTNLASINMTQLRNCPIPLPSTATQDRIISKVTELMSLCDALEAKLKQTESASSELLSATVHHLLSN